jgi:metal-responsive CopG/Arc/MetJ family transcriptional regulator
MESVTIKIDKNLAGRLENAMKKGYSTKTEFIREAIRKKLEEEETDILIREFMKSRGKAKKNTSYEENRKTREIVSEELLKKLEKRFS